MSFTIRPLTVADVDAFRALRLRGLREVPTAFAASWEEEREQPRRFFLDRLSAAEDRHNLGAFDGDTLVGMLALLRESKRKLRHKGLIVGVYVAPEVRQRGIGRALIDAALRVADVQMGLRQVNLSVHSANTPALALYESAGFVAYGIEVACLIVDGEPQDETHMVHTFVRRAQSG